MPWEYWCVTMMEKFGWTIEQWENLDSRDHAMIIAVWDGIAKAQD